MARPSRRTTSRAPPASRRCASWTTAASSRSPRGSARCRSQGRGLMPTNYERAFTERPEVYAAWVQLNTSIKANMDLRRYELATFAAAQRLRSSYCSLAHGSVLRERFDEPVVALARDRRSAGL